MPSISVAWDSDWDFIIELAFSQSLWLLQLTCSCAFSCSANDTHNFIGVLTLSLFIASSSWLPSRPTTWLAVALSLATRGLGLVAGFFPVFLLGFLEESGASGRGLSPRSHLL